MVECECQDVYFIKSSPLVCGVMCLQALVSLYTVTLPHLSGHLSSSTYKGTFLYSAFLFFVFVFVVVVGVVKLGFDRVGFSG